MDTERLAAEKAALRAAVRLQAAARSEESRRQSDDLLFARFLALAQVKRAQSILLFWGQGIEPHTQRLCQQLLAAGKCVCLPRCLPGRQMEARQITDETPLIDSAFGIPEPDERAKLVPKTDLDLILAPALCCDRAGYRLGQGGGYYDRYLADYTGETITLCRAALLQERLPRGGYDRAVNVVLTEDESLSPAQREQSGDVSPPCRL